MMKCEFEQRLGKEVPQELYNDIELIYMNYPGIGNKDGIVDIFKILGEKGIADLLPRAKQIQDHHDNIHNLELQIAKEKEKIKALK